MISAACSWRIAASARTAASRTVASSSISARSVPRTQCDIIDGGASDADPSARARTSGDS